MISKRALEREIWEGKGNKGKDRKKTSKGLRARKLCDSSYILHIHLILILIGDHGPVDGS